MPRKMNDKTATLAQLRKMMADFVRRRQWNKYHRPKNLAMSIAIETAELMEHFQWLDHEQADEALADPTLREQVADEMADILSFLLSLSNASDIDLSAAFVRKMKKTVRKYPAAKCKGNYSKPHALLAAADNASGAQVPQSGATPERRKTAFRGGRPGTGSRKGWGRLKFTRYSR